MGKVLNYIVISLLLICSLALKSCSNDGCTENQSSIPLAGFYSTETGESIAMSMLEVYGIDASDKNSLTDKNNPIKQVYLPLRATQNNTAFLIHYGEYGDAVEYNDTIWIDYNTTPYFASEECGATFRYEITSIRHTDLFIDSIEVVDPVITNVDVERIKIFFKTY